MDLRSRIAERAKAFWIAATVGVPVILSAALLLILVLEMTITAADIHHLTARVMALAIVEALIIGGTVWGLRQASDLKIGATVVAAVVSVVVLVGWVLTL